MKVGDIVMVRSLTTHFRGEEVSGSVTYSARDLDGGTRKHSEKSAFVLMLLGEDKLADPRLDAVEVLNRIGLWSEKQLSEAMGEEEATALLKKMAAGEEGG